MSAPERIYLDNDAEAGDGYFTRCFETAKPCSEPAIEYLRADLCTPTDERVARLIKALQNVIAEYDEFRKDEYMRGLASLDDEIHDARAALRDMGVG